ncbi:hypothetical protein Tco_1164868 [Tanacetum coccineum]
MRIGTRSEEVKAAARTMGCTKFSTPLVHLGVKVGGVMSRINSWDNVVAKVRIDDSLLQRRTSLQVEFASHLFFACPMAHQLRRKFMHWWELEDIDLASYDDWILLLHSSRFSKRPKDILEGVCYLMVVNLAL